MTTFDTPSSAAFSPLGSATPLELDVAKYQAEIAELDLSEAEQSELLGTLWVLLQNMVELGFSVADSDICGSIFGEPNQGAIASPTAVESASDMRTDKEANR